jgi:hypothetical protein
MAAEKNGAKSETNGELGVALAGAIRAAQAIRHAARGRLISEAQTVLSTAGKVTEALKEL